MREKYLILIVMLYFGCLSERDDCLEKLNRKVNGDAVCEGAIFLPFSNNADTRQLANIALIQCLDYSIQEKRCQNKSALLPRGLER